MPCSAQAAVCLLMAVSQPFPPESRVKRGATVGDGAWAFGFGLPPTTKAHTTRRKVRRSGHHRPGE